MHRLSNILLALTLAGGLAACGGGYSGFKIPIESELKPWVSPEADELLGEDDDDDEDYEDYVDEEDGDAPAAKPAAPAAPAPKK
jgi:hypothetical protein